MHSLFDRAVQAIIVADEDRRVLYANAPGAAFLESQEDLFAENSRLQAGDAATEAALRHAFAALCEGAAWGEVVGVLPLRRGLRLPLMAFVIRIPWLGGNGSGAPRRAALLLGHDPHAPCAIGQLGAGFGLTAAETRVVERLLQGESLREACVALGITENTGRTHLKAVFAKTGARSQADLVRLFCIKPHQVLARPTLRMGMPQRARATFIPHAGDAT